MGPKVILAGGSSRIPKVQQMLSQLPAKNSAVPQRLGVYCPCWSSGSLMGRSSLPSISVKSSAKSARIRNSEGADLFVTMFLFQP